MARILRKAAALIEPPGRWTQGWLARNRHGEGVAPNSSSAVCWCARGAIERYRGGVATEEALEAQIGTLAIGAWNDDTQRTQDEVVAALRAAADEAERS